MADLDCKTCSGEDKRWRGCGRAPRFPVIEFDEQTLQDRHTERVWTPTWWFSWCEQNELAVSGENASDQWEWANTGNIVDLLGVPWECCPRSYLREDMVDRDALELASYALQIHAWRDKGSLSALDPGPLTPGMVDLVGLIERNHNLRFRLKKEEIERKHKGGGADD